MSPPRPDRWRAPLLGLVLGAALFNQPAAQAQESQSPGFQWNLGLGLAALSYPRWRGADEDETLALPLPTFAIWTENTRLGRSGISVKMNWPGHWQLRLSVSGSLPVDSEDSSLRRGMADLDPTLEAGPALVWAPPKTGLGQLKAEMLLRGIGTIDLEQPEWLGWTLQPRLAWHWATPVDARGQGWSGRIATGPIWAQSKYHEYFYTVRPGEVLPGRPAFAAAGGYSGSRVNLVVTHLRGRARITGYVGYDNLSGASFEDSPLAPETDYWVAGLFASWRFYGEAQPLEQDD